MTTCTDETPCQDHPYCPCERTRIAAGRIRTALLAEYGDPELFDGATTEDVEQAKVTHGRWLANADENARIRRAGKVTPCDD